MKQEARLDIGYGPKGPMRPGAKCAKWSIESRSPKIKSFAQGNNFLSGQFREPNKYLQIWVGSMNAEAKKVHGDLSA